MIDLLDSVFDSFLSDEFSSQEFPSQYLFSEELPSDDLASGDLASGDLASGDLSSGDLSSGDLASDDLDSDDSILSDWNNFVSSGGQDSFLSSVGSSASQILFPDVVTIEIVDDDEPVSLADGSLIPFADVDPITPSDANGLKAVLLSVIGDYESIIVEYRYQNSGSSTYQYLRQVTPDYPWLMSCALFIVMIISLFRIAGGFLWKR